MQALLTFKAASINFDICGREHLSSIVINHCLSEYSDCSQAATDEPHEVVLSLHGLGLSCAHREVGADVSNQVSPVPRKLVEAFKHKADEFSGSFKDGLKASATFPLGEVPTLAPKAALKISCCKWALTIFS